MNRLRCITPLLLLCTPLAKAGILRQGAVQILCHRTANRHAPENTLESLALASRMGCNVIEVDVRRTLDGELVLNHDGYLDRFTDTTGDIETTELRELDRMDFGAWMGERYRGMHIAHFDDALRLARTLNVDLYLDIKSKGLGPQILAALAREGMTERVIFGGEWDDVRALKPNANREEDTYLQPGMTSAEIEKLHHEGKTVVANFLSNGHETDLPGMRAAVAAGVDSLWVEYPRLGAEAAGRPVESALSRLAARAEKGTTADRVAAIRELSLYTGFPLQKHFLHWLLDSDDGVSHEAAIALIASRPAVTIAALVPALSASSAAARRNAAWAVGSIAASSNDAPCAPILAPLIDDADNAVVKASLLALVQCSHPEAAAVPSVRLLTLLSNTDPVTASIAAMVLAKYHPDLAARAVPERLAREEADTAAAYAARNKPGQPKLTQPEIDVIIEHYRAQMKYMRALSMLPRDAAFGALVAQAFRSVHDYSMVTGLVAGYQLWDRLGEAPQPAIAALSSTDNDVADRAEWSLVEAGVAVLPAVRAAMLTSSGEVRRRLIRVAAWQADEQAIPLLHQLETTDPSDAALILWAIEKIQSMQVPV